jgi:hypothetical protein
VTRQPVLPIAAASVLVAVIVVAVFGLDVLRGPSEGAPTGAAIASPPADPGSTGGSALATPGGTPRPSAAVPSPAPSAAPPAEPAPTDAAAPPSSEPGRSTAEHPQVRFGEFALRIGTARDAIEQLNADLWAALQADDVAASLQAGDAIHEFVITEQAWLERHPPTTCYGEAHAAAEELLSAYDEAAARAGTWVSTPQGLERIRAFGSALEALDETELAAESFGEALEDHRCLA